MAWSLNMALDDESFIARNAAPAATQQLSNTDFPIGYGNTMAGFIVDGAYMIVQCNATVANRKVRVRIQDDTPFTHYELVGNASLINNSTTRTELAPAHGIVTVLNGPNREQLADYLRVITGTIGSVGLIFDISNFQAGDLINEVGVRGRILRRAAITP